MDDTVIQEIANQLGLAVDKAGDFVFEMLPGYAGMKAAQATLMASISGLIFILALIASIKCIRYLLSKYHEIESSRTLMSKYPMASACAIGLAVAIIVAIIAFVVLCTAANALVTWGLFPEGALMDLVMSKVG